MVFKALRPELAITPERENYEENRKERAKNESPGDYAYKYDNEKIAGYYPDGTAAVHLEDGDHPVYNAPKKGDVLADDPDAQFTKINGAWYVIDPENAEKCWYTSKEPSIEVQKKEEYKKTIDENENLLLLGIAGRDAGMGLNKGTTKNIETIIKGPSEAEIKVTFRNIPEGGATIIGRKYTEHALERMAPNTPEIRAELRTKYDKIAEEKGLVPGSIEYNNFINKNIEPRGITPTVVEDAIKNTKPTDGNTAGTFVHENENVKVIVNENGDVITVIPR
jgi:hypothetical protein